MRGEGFAIAGQGIVGEQVQAPLRHHRRIELADRAGGGVTRIRKTRLAQFFTLRIDPFEDSARQVSLATHFDFGGDFFRSIAQLKRNAANGAHVWRHVFAAKAVAAGDAARKQPGVVVNRKRQPVYLKLGYIIRRFAAGEFATALIERPQFVNVVAVIERQHRTPVDEFGKSFGRPAADALSWTVRCDQLGMFFFQLAQPVDQLVVLAIGNFRIVVKVIEVFVAANLFAPF